MAAPTIKNPLLDALGEALHTHLDPSGAPHQIAREILIFLYKYLVIYADYLLFAVATVPIYFLIPRRFRVGYLLAVSLGMIAIVWGAVYTAIMLGVVSLSHGLVQHFRERAVADPVFRKRVSKWMIGVILAIYGALLLRESLEWTPVIPIWNRELIFPLVHFAGIAFMLPKLIHYIVDSFNGRLPRSRWLPFALFMMFFPIFRLGPIETYQAFSRTIAHISRQRLTAFDVLFGLYRIALGSLKIAIFWTVLLPWREAGMDHVATVGMWRVYISIILGVIEVYFHFGGYTDLAVGLSRLFGLRVMENFYFPMFSRNIGEWWRRWHISLSFWLRDYVYRPLGGGKSHAMRNGLLTFFICGAWHDISSHYIIWGVMQGVGLGGLRVWAIFWHRVAHDERYMRPLKPLYAFMHARPRFSWALAVFVTYHYFAYTGIYFILDTHRANICFVRLISFGMLNPG
jgi:alginate O-acetyltransferase complex protein AlgI